MCRSFVLRILTGSALVVVLAAAGIAMPARAHAQYTFSDFSKVKEPSIIMTRLAVNVQRFTRYAPDPKKEPTYGQWSWAPRFSFALRGPITGGSQVNVIVSKPNGKPWLTLPVQTPELEPGAWDTAQTDDQEESNAITLTGVCNFSIVMTNELEGTKKVLYTGKFEVSKYQYPLSKKPGETEFFINHDWLLPVAYLEIDASGDEEAPMLAAYFWFKGDVSADNPDAYVYYNGKQIFSTKSEGAGRGIADVTLTTPGVDKERTWFRWKFEFGGVRVYRRKKDQSANNYTQFFLSKNPGNYEIKVLRTGKLSRVLAFSVGKDGKIVNNGLADKNHLSTAFMLVPATITPGTDLPFSLTASKAPFYGQPWQLK